SCGRARTSLAQGPTANAHRVVRAHPAGAAQGGDHGAGPRAAAGVAVVLRPRLPAWDAEDLVRHCDRLDELAGDLGRDPQRLRQAVELVEDTRVRFQLNVSEELACEALAYRLERVLAA